MPTLISILKETAAYADSGITFIDANGCGERLSYQGLLEEALKALGALQEKGIRAKDELVILVEDNRSFLVLFWACILGNIRPVPLSAGVQPEKKRKLALIWQYLLNPYLVADDKQLEMLLSLSSPQQEAGQWTGINSVTIPLSTLFNSQENGIMASVDEDDIAYIQFSSGSTGDPKGICLTHRNLLCNIGDIIRSLAITGSDVLLSWMPLTHDMGLIGFHLTGVVARLNTISIPVGLFIKRPLVWMDKTSEHKATVLYSPNFGLHYFLSACDQNKRYDWDLSGVRIIVNGAESISVALCRRFIRAMKHYGLGNKPFVTAYGLAEASVEVAAMPPGEDIISHHLHRAFLNIGDVVRVVEADEPAGVSFADVGFPISSCALRICDHYDSMLPEDSIGHIQIKGENVTAGYYNNMPGTKKLFTGDGWLRTGDVGLLHKGRLVITGRLKDIIIINGQNYYPQDIEQCIITAGAAELGKVVACGAGGTDQQEELIVFVLHKGSPFEFLPAVNRIKNIVLRQIGLHVDQVIPVKRIPKTTSGKIQRFELLRQHREGGFDSWRAFLEEQNETVLSGQRAAIGEEEMMGMVVDLLGSNNMDAKSNLIAQGLNSISAMKLSNMIKKRTGIDMPVSLLFKCPTVRELCQHVLTKEGAEEVVRWERGTKGPAFDLTLAQKRIWLECEVNKNSPFYNIPLAFGVEGDLDKLLLTKALQQLIQKYEILRTSFHAEGEELRQLVHEYRDDLFCPEEITLTGKAGSPLEAGGIGEEIANTPFDLGQPTQCRLVFVVVNEKVTYLILVIHHIITDGWSLQKLMQELAVNYNKLKNKQDTAVKETAWQYRDYVHWTSRMINTGEMRRQEKYWLTELANFPEPVDITSMKRSRPQRLAKKVHHYKYLFSPEQHALLRSLGVRYETTPFTVVLALLNLLLYRYTAGKDIVLAYDVNGRISGQLEELLGYTLNTLCIRCPVAGDSSFASILQVIKEKILAGIGHQLYPFEMLAENEEIRRCLPDNRLFHILILYQQFGPVGFSQFDGFSLRKKELYVKEGFVDLVMEFSEEEEGLDLLVQYNEALYTHTEIRQLVDHLARLLPIVAERATEPVSRYDLLSLEEKKALLPVRHPGEEIKHVRVPVHLLFEWRTSIFPDRVAVVTEGRSITYADLNAMANAIAHHIQQAYAIQPDDKVGFIVSRNSHVVIAMLAILKSGAAFVAIDPDWPPARCGKVMTDSGMKCLLTDDAIASQVVTYCSEELLVNINDVLLTGGRSDNPVQRVTMDHLAYIIYTSGSTGQPKGVMIEHRTLLNYVRNFTNYFNITGEDVFIQQSSVAFDTMIEEIFPALCTSARIVMAKEGARDIRALLQLIAANKVTVLTTTPMVLNEINRQTDSRIASLRLVISGGDVLHRTHIDNLFRNVEIYNTYGPSEATVCATYMKISSLEQVGLIGTPIEGYHVYILDEDRNMLPGGKVGEIYIEGGLARGYLNLPEETATAFVVSPMDDTKKCYRSGDCGRWTEDGYLEFKGRLNNVVKIRGMRIDVEGIEKTILDMETVKEVAVVISEAEPGDKSMLAYVVGEEGFSMDKLKEYLRGQLPAYMIPSVFKVLPKMPVNSSGKTDRIALQAKALVDAQYREARKITSPESTTEFMLKEVWERALERKNISTDENFFEIGGHSLKANRVINMIAARMEVELRLADIFACPTIQQLGILIDQHRKKNYRYIEVT